MGRWRRFMVENIGKNNQVAPLDPLGPITNVKGKTQGKTSDSIGKSSGSQESKNILADSPELQAAQYILWFGSNNQLALQLYSGKNDTSLGKLESSNFDLFKLQFENDMHAVAIKVLDAWSKSIHDEVEAARKEEKSHRLRSADETTELAGHEVYQQTLISGQVGIMIDADRMTKVANIEAGAAQGLSDYLSKSKVGDNIPFVSGIALSIGTPQTNSLSGGVGAILDKAAPSYSVDLATLANLYVNMSMNIATTHTLLNPKAPVQKIDYEFAKSYAHQILKEISSSDFNNWAMAIVTHGMGPSEMADEKSVKTLVGKLKIAMLSTALALLYQTETAGSTGIKSGGISGQEFVSMIKGDMPVDSQDPKKSIILQIRNLIGDPMAPEDASGILAAASSWIDQSSKGESLLKVSPLFDAMKANSNLAISSATFSI
jgi:hypothetical protein